MTRASSIHANAPGALPPSAPARAVVEIELPRKLRLADLAPLLGRHLEQRDLTDLLVELNRDGALAGKSHHGTLAKGTRLRIPDPDAPENGGLFDVGAKASEFARRFAVPSAPPSSRPTSPASDFVERSFQAPLDTRDASARTNPVTAQAPMPPPPARAVHTAGFLEDFYHELGPPGSAVQAQAANPPAPTHTFLDRDHAPPPTASAHAPRPATASSDPVPTNPAPTPATVDFNIASAYRNAKREFTDTMVRGAERYERLIDKAAELYEIPADLIAAVIAQESKFNPNVSSPVGATGLMQLMPGTARDLGLAVNKKIDERRNPEKNVLAGTKYLAGLLERYDNDLVKAVAAYNAGPGAVDKYGGVPPYKETRDYVAKVVGYYQGLTEETNSG